MNWTTEPPNKPGDYWFYGDWWGSMGIHYRDNPPPVEPKLYWVKVIKISNGIAAITEGRFESLKKFNNKKFREGYIGYWSPAELPEAPFDFDNLWT